MNKEQVKTIIEKLKPKRKRTSMSYNECQWTSQSDPVLIGDVLERMASSNNIAVLGDIYKVVDRWRNCGFTKSLQEIIECGFEDMFSSDMHAHIKPEDVGKQQPKDPNVRELFEPLNNIV